MGSQMTDHSNTGPAYSSTDMTDVTCTVVSEGVICPGWILCSLLPPYSSVSLLLNKGNLSQSGPQLDKQ